MQKTVPSFYWAFHFTYKYRIYDNDSREEMIILKNDDARKEIREPIKLEKNTLNALENTCNRYKLYKL